MQNWAHYTNPIKYLTIKLNFLYSKKRTSFLVQQLYILNLLIRGNPNEKTFQSRCSICTHISFR